MNDPRRPTMRCKWCNVNYPHHVRYTQCPLCDNDNASLYVDDADTILTEADVQELLIAEGVIAGPALAPGFSTAPAAAGPDTGRAFAQLRADLDNWAHRRPHWMK